MNCDFRMQLTLILFSFFTYWQLKAEDVLLRGLTWSRLLDPDKKGQWWLSGDVPSTVANVEDVAAVTSKDVVETKTSSACSCSVDEHWHTKSNLLYYNECWRLCRCFWEALEAGPFWEAGMQSMFLKISCCACIWQYYWCMPFPVLDMQDREIIRVIVDCCLHEKMFNKYYTVLASKLCNHEKNHKFSLQVYCCIYHVCYLY